jgi:hypothetical protein
MARARRYRAALAGTALLAALVLVSAVTMGV